MCDGSETIIQSPNQKKSSVKKRWQHLYLRKMGIIPHWVLACSALEPCAYIFNRYCGSCCRGNANWANLCVFVSAFWTQIATALCNIAEQLSNQLRYRQQTWHAAPVSLQPPLGHRKKSSTVETLPLTPSRQEFWKN